MHFRIRVPIIIKNIPKNDLKTVTISFGLSSSLSKNFVTENPFITEVTESTESTGNHLSVYNWEIVDGWFTEYPLSIGMNRFLIFDQFSVWLKNPISDLLQSIKRLMNV